MSTLVTASPEPRRLWIRVQPATPVQSSTYQPTTETVGLLWAACAVLCLLLYGILAALKEIVGRTTCLSFLLLVMAALLWLIAKNSKLSYNYKVRWVTAAASAMTVLGICLLNTSRATPLLLSAQALAAPIELKDSDPLIFMNAHPLQNKMPPTVTAPRLPRGETPASQLAGYIAGVKDSVSQKWNLSEVAASTPAGATVYIQFAVRRSGNHEVPTVETSSGSSSLDASCVRAVSRNHAFGHFPNSYTGDSLTVLYHCTYPGSAEIKSTQDSSEPPVQQPTAQIAGDGVPRVQPPTR